MLSLLNLLLNDNIVGKRQSQPELISANVNSRVFRIIFIHNICRRFLNTLYTKWQTVWEGEGRNQFGMSCIIYTMEKVGASRAFFFDFEGVPAFTSNNPSISLHRGDDGWQSAFLGTVRETLSSFKRCFPWGGLDVRDCKEMAGKVCMPNEENRPSVRSYFTLSLGVVNKKE